MEQLLRCVNIMNIIIAVSFFYVRITGAIDQNEITSDSTLQDAERNEFSVIISDNCCQCIEYDCGCCQHIEWDGVSLNGTLCANASFLRHDLGISVTLTYNNFTIINETVSARNPPPICFGEDIVPSISVDICLRIRDINLDCHKYHACFDILGEIARFRIFTLSLGCVNTKIQEKMQYIKNNAIFHMLPLISKRLGIA